MGLWRNIGEINSVKIMKMADQRIELTLEGKQFFIAQFESRKLCNVLHLVEIDHHKEFIIHADIIYANAEQT